MVPLEASCSGDDPGKPSKVSSEALEGFLKNLGRASLCLAPKGLGKNERRRRAPSQRPASCALLTESESLCPQQTHLSFLASLLFSPVFLLCVFLLALGTRPPRRSSQDCNGKLVMLPPRRPFIPVLLLSVQLLSQPPQAELRGRQWQARGVPPGIHRHGRFHAYHRRPPGSLREN